MKRSERTANRKFHIIYKTTCLVTGKFYIGMHSTNDLDDGYMGSGKYLRNSISKHGLEKHIMEILEYLPSRDKLRLREAELVNQDMLLNFDCMNLALGGDGGWELVNSNRTDAEWKAIQQAGGKAVLQLLSTRHAEKMKSDQAYSANIAEKIKLGIANMKTPRIWEYKHTEESKKKIVSAKKGKYLGISNPSSGKPWIYHLELKQCKKIQAEELEAYLAEGWLKGRKMVFAPS
jgi:hypothetical protein